MIDALLPFGLIIHALEDGQVSSTGTDAEKPYHLVRRGLVEGRYGEPALRAAADRGHHEVFHHGRRAVPAGRRMRALTLRDARCKRPCRTCL